ncbi:MAG TPA: hypothetical protein DHW82_10670 [Spirochaetia bacterium]|nr:MAG: hypothetical protein A2Y41_10940 [Spirochaetes bacterium GWB1_36_13]HCL57456.1 hypothetical protein [Spirochaetia bacterium]
MGHHRTGKQDFLIEKIGIFVKQTLLKRKVFNWMLLALLVVVVVAIAVVIVRENHRKEVKALYTAGFYKYKEIGNQLDDTNKARAGAAKAELEKVIEKGYQFPEYYLAQFNIGNIYIFLNEPDKAKKYFQAVEEADKDFFVRPKAMLGLARIFQNEGNYEEALKIYERVLNDYQDYNQDFAHYLMGICYEKKGEIDKAVENYKKIREDSSYKAEADKSLEIIEKLNQLK